MFKKSILAIGITVMIVSGTTSVMAFPQAGTPKVTWNLKNNSTGSIKLVSTNCGADTSNFPSSISVRGSASVLSKGNYAGVYACRVSYQLTSGSGKCEFNVARTLKNLGNPITGANWVWNAPTVVLMNGSSSQCSGRISSVKSD